VSIGVLAENVVLNVFVELLSGAENKSVPVVSLVVDEAVADRNGQVESAGLCFLADGEIFRVVGGNVLEFHLDAELFF
jgi:hypothetical protein